MAKKRVVRKKAPKRKAKTVRKKTAKKKVSKKTVKKKTVKRAVPKPMKKTMPTKRIKSSSGHQAMRMPRRSARGTRNRILMYLLKFLAFFVICLILYFVVNNYVLWVLFGIGAIIGGAISFALLLVLIGYLITKRR